LPSETTHSKTATGKAATLAELRAFVAELDALGAAGETPIEARGGWSGSRKLTAKIVRSEVERPGARPFGEIDDDGHLADSEYHGLWQIAVQLAAGREGEAAAFLALHGIEVYRMWQPGRDAGEG
jgi:hypothetical protein